MCVLIVSDSFIHKIQSYYIVLNHFNLILCRIHELSTWPCLHPGTPIQIDGV